MRLVVFFALVVGAAVAILFSVFPAWDLAISGYFWDVGRKGFPLAMQPWAKTARSLANYIPWLICAPAIVALVLKLLFPDKPMFMSARAALLLVITMALGPGLIVNGILKENWGRPRPVHVEDFGGKDVYRPWYETDGTCPGNCSFVSGEGALGFWLTAPASLVPGPAGAVAMVGALAFGATAGGLRIAFGGHFFTDVVFSGVLVVLVVVLTRYWLYDRKNAPSDFKAERTIGRWGFRLHGAARLLVRSITRFFRALTRRTASLAGRHLPPRGTGL